MPADPLDQLGPLVLSGAIVGGVAAPFALLGWGAARALGRPVLPRRLRLRAGWTGPDIVFLFLLNFGLTTFSLVILSGSGFFQWAYGPDFPSMESAGDQQLQFLWAIMVTTPVVMLTAAWVWFGLHGRPMPGQLGELPGQVALGAIGWALLTPVVFAVHFLAIVLSNRFGGTVEDHPLVQLGGGASLLDQVFFGLVVCVVTPLIEEFLFRGLLVRWAAGRMFRPWALMGVAAVLSLFRGADSLAPLAFVAALAGGLLVLTRLMRNLRVGVREAAGVYASAALFAIAHSAVWPSPVPLFVLGLGLGYLALRTGGIAACVVLHGLFNAVSYVLLLRGGAA